MTDPNVYVQPRLDSKQQPVGEEAHQGGSDADEQNKLAGLGYSQVLHRGWRKITNVAVCVSSTSVLLSIYSSFSTGLGYGGPVVCLWGWVFASIGGFCVALGMAELTSAYPTSGGMYYWIHKLSAPSYGPVLCWVIGWLNLLGQIASLSSTHYVMAKIIEVIVLLSTGTGAATYPSPPPNMPDFPGAPPLAPPPNAPATPNAPLAPWPPGQAPPDAPPAWVLEPGPGFTFNIYQQYGIYCFCILMTTLMNSMPFHAVGWLTDFGAIWHVVGILMVIIIIPCIATQHASADWVFRHFETEFARVFANIDNQFYVFILGLLLPAYSLTGFDGPAHMAEESHGASTAAPKGIVWGVVFTIVAGWVWCLSLLFCVTDLNYDLGDYSTPEGYPAALGDIVPQIFYSAFQQRFGVGMGGIIMLGIVLGGTYFCAHSTMTYVARIMFCYSRDRAVPLSWLWTKFNHTTQSPLWAVWGAAIATVLIGLPMLGDETAFTAILSLSTIALNIAYVLPTTARITWGRHRYTPGPWNLGIWIYPVGIIATLWVAFIVVVFSLPTVYPVTGKNLNYAGIMLLGVAILSLCFFYFPYYGAYKWFDGPAVTVVEAESGNTISAAAPIAETDALSFSNVEAAKAKQEAELVPGTPGSLIPVNPTH